MPTADELEQLVNEALNCGIGPDSIKRIAEKSAGEREKQSEDCGLINSLNKHEQNESN